jgi:hypothetical protein
VARKKRSDKEAEAVAATADAPSSVTDTTPERYVLLMNFTSLSQGFMPAGSIVTRDGFLAGNDDETMNIFLQRGALRPAREDE